MIALIALVLGIVAGLVFRPTLPPGLAPYLPVIVVAAIDVVLEGVRTRLEGGYRESEFLVAFVTNTALAAFIVWVAIRLGVPDLSIGVIIVFGIRIFQSLTAIRRHVFRE